MVFLSNRANLTTGSAQEYLAPATQDMFQAVVTEYLWLPWQHAQQQRGASGSSQVGAAQHRSLMNPWIHACKWLSLAAPAAVWAGSVLL